MAVPRVTMGMCVAQRSSVHSVPNAISLAIHEFELGGSSLMCSGGNEGREGSALPGRSPSACALNSLSTAGGKLCSSTRRGMWFWRE